MNFLQPMTIAGLLVGGMGAALLGSVKVPLARRLEIDEARVGGLISLFGFTMIPVILSAGFLTDLVGKQLVLIAGSLLMSAALVVLALGKRYTWALLSILMLSASWSALINVINVLTPPSFLEPSEIPSRIAHATNLANVYFGLGAFLTPLGIAYVVRQQGFRTALIIPAVLVLIPAALSMTVDWSTLEAGSNATTAATASKGMAELLSNPMLWLCAAAMFFYGPLEASMAGWSTTFLGEQGVKENRASLLLSGFWLAFMLSRLITALTIPAGFEAQLIFVLSIGVVAILAGIVLCRGAGIAIALVLAAGFVFGPVFPTIMALLLGNIDQSLHGRAVGVFFAVGGLGWTTIPMLIGYYAKRTTLQRGFLIAVGSGIGLILIALLLLTR